MEIKIYPVIGKMLLENTKKSFSLPFFLHICFKYLHHIMLILGSHHIHHGGATIHTDHPEAFLPAYLPSAPASLRE